MFPVLAIRSPALQLVVRHPHRTFYAVHRTQPLPAIQAIRIECQKHLDAFRRCLILRDLSLDRQALIDLLERLMQITVYESEADMTESTEVQAQFLLRALRTINRNAYQYG